MKKHIVLSIIIGLLAANTIFSQNEVRFGINGGLTFSKFQVDESLNRLEIGVNVITGISFEFEVNENLSLKTNLNYERKSMNKEASFSSPYNNLDIKTIYTYGYITAPIMVKYKLVKSSNLYFNAGPFLGYLLHKQNKSSGVTKALSVSDIAKFDYGLSFGIGTKIKLDKEVDLGIELRENLGLMNISTSDEDEEGKIKTQAVNLIVTIDFDI